MTHNSQQGGTPSILLKNIVKFTNSFELFFSLPMKSVRMLSLPEIEYFHSVGKRLPLISPVYRLHNVASSDTIIYIREIKKGKELISFQL
jgi:hypothetical protein